MVSEDVRIQYHVSHLEQEPILPSRSINFIKYINQQYHAKQLTS